jgi:short-subunit dehydrogenase
VEDFRRLFEVNVMGQIHGAKAALPHLRRSHGALVCLGSVASDRGLPLASAYSASKHALKGWLDALRVELERDRAGVRVTLIKPTSIDTPIFDHARTWLGVKPKGFAPVYAPELVARAILHAATHDDRDVYVGGMGKALSVLEHLSPRLVDAQQRRTAFEGQRTREVRDANAPNNLWSPLPSDGGERGTFGGRVHERALFPWASEHPWVLPAAAVALFGLVRAFRRA